MGTENKGEWHKGIIHGSLRREFTGAFGQRIQESLYPTRGKTLRFEQYPDGSTRDLYIPHAEQDEIHQFLSRTIISNPELRFYDYVNHTGTEIELTKSGLVTVSLLKARKEQPLEMVLPDVDSVVVVNYDNNGIQSVSMQAETRSEIHTPRIPDEPSSTVHDGFHQYINTVKIQDDNSLYAHAQALDTVIDSKIKEKFSEDGPTLAKVHETVAKGMQRASELLPPDDRDMYLHILQKAGFQQKLLWELMLSIDPNTLSTEHLDALDIDQLLLNAFNEEIHDLNDDSEEQVYASVQQLSVSSFDDHSFAWSEKEDGTDYELTYEEMLSGVISDRLTEPAVIHESITPYGSSIHIQDNIFIIQREGDTINVNCIGPRKKNRWKAAFDLKPSVPLAEIRDIINDQESDFRKIRELLPVQLITGE